MKRVKVMSVFGTRPDTIKMAPVVHALRKHAEIDEIVCVTAQHRKMLDDLLVFFAITPAYDLDVMTEDQTLTEITTRVLIGMEPCCAKRGPTSCSFTAIRRRARPRRWPHSIARIPVGHVEAGLRTQNRWMPYPEEMNRRLTAAITSYHFAPTALAREHLLQEHVASNDVFVTGNTVIDAFWETATRADLPPPPQWSAIEPGRPAIVVTAHRRENHEHMREIALALREIAALPARPQLYWPVHPSPHVAPVAHQVLDGVPGVVLVEPIEYGAMVAAVKASAFVLTDSGGLQEEAPCLGKPVLVMREETERPEGLDVGHVGAGGSRSGAYRRRRPALARRRESLRGDGARRQSLRRRPGERTDRPMARGAAPGAARIRSPCTA